MCRLRKPKYRMHHDRFRSMLSNRLLECQLLNPMSHPKQCPTSMAPPRSLKPHQTYVPMAIGDTVKLSKAPESLEKPIANSHLKTSQKFPIWIHAYKQGLNRPIGYGGFLVNRSVGSGPERIPVTWHAVRAYCSEKLAEGFQLNTNGIMDYLWISKPCTAEM